MGKYKNATDLDLQCVKWRKELMHVHNKISAKATIDHPPNSDEFDPEKCKAALHLDRQTPSTPTAGDQFTPFAHAITSVTSLAAAMLGCATPILPEMPTCPHTQHLPIELGSSPPAPSPSHLGRFLTYTQDHLGVRSALSFEDKMAEHSYSPDILHKVPKADLTTLGIPAGDVIRLQNGSQKWWKGPDVKRKRSESSIAEVWGRDDKRVQYEVIFAVGGGNCFTAGPLESGNPRSNCDVFNYFNEALSEMVPIPPGYQAPAQSVEEELAGSSILYIEMSMSQQERNLVSEILISYIHEIL
ncbi:hypothetical protein JAAARDRAFT_188381 [Jaapia argillacea MUCL 33604]|uniref:Uncharacterized protein n=1 Tax=Jaapia argillacea MUCL 33604 TaxID=933084 RepID=A0A067QG04_9AGAM|nr:hypothetical protein JAAARDRAFT_188381 [Jaapia argillacea MUCL 33604]